MKKTEEVVKKEYIKWLQDNLEKYIYLDDAANKLKEKIKECSLKEGDDEKEAEKCYIKFAGMLHNSPVKAIFGKEYTGIIYKDVRYGLYKDNSKMAVPFPFFLHKDGLQSVKSDLFQQIIKNNICLKWTRDNEIWGKKLADEFNKDLKILAIRYGKKLNGFHGFPALEKFIKLICGSLLLFLSAMILFKDLKMLGDNLVSVLSWLTAFFSNGYFLHVLIEDAHDLTVVTKIERYWRYSIKEMKIVRAKMIEIENQLKKIRNNIEEKKYFNEEFDNLYLNVDTYTGNKWLQENNRYIRKSIPWPESVLKKHHFFMLLLVVLMLSLQTEDNIKIDIAETKIDAYLNEVLEPVNKRHMGSYTAYSYQDDQIELQGNLTAILIRDTEQAPKGEDFSIRSSRENENGEPVISGETVDGTEISELADSLMISYPGYKCPEEAEGYADGKTTIRKEDLIKLTDRRTSTVWTGEEDCLPEFTFRFDAEQEDTMINMLHISNGNLTSSKSYHENSRIREVKITVNDTVYYTSLEDTFNPLGYNIPFPKTVYPGIIKIKVTDVYHGERNDKLSIAGFDFYKS